VRAQTTRPTAPNEILKREPELASRLVAFRSRVNDMLADKLAAQSLNDPAFRVKECPYPLADVKATAIILRMLTKPEWDTDDFLLFDKYWRQTSCADLFGDEFVAEYHRLQQCIEICRKHVAPRLDLGRQ
jgi:hypothetical protein